jgi:hypothetical protein
MEESEDSHQNEISVRFYEQEFPKENDLVMVGRSSSG